MFTDVDQWDDLIIPHVKRLTKATRITKSFTVSRLYILIRNSFTHASFLGFTNMSAIPLIRAILLSVTGCLSFVANPRGKTMRFWFRSRRPLTVALAQKLWPRAKNLVGFVLFVDEAGFGGRCSHSSRSLRGPWNFLSQFYKITSPNCQQYPSHCSILEM